MLRAMPLIVALALFGCTRSGADPGSTQSSSDPEQRLVAARMAQARADSSAAVDPSQPPDGALETLKVEIALNAQDCIKRTATTLMHNPLLNGEHIDKQTVKDQLTLRCGQTYIDWATQHQVQQAAASIAQVDEWEELAYDNELTKDQ